MPLPGGATGFTLTGGPYDDPSFEGMTAKLTTNVPVTHLATGERLRTSWTVTIDYSGNFTVGPLPFSDDPAFTPNGFTYTMTWQALSYKPTPGNLTFAVPMASGATVDFDTLGAATPGQPALPTTVFSVNGHTGAVTLAKADVGLGNVDNTADTAKPVSTAQATALAGKLAVASNLSDVASAATARTNLGLGSAATQPTSAFDAAGAAALRAPLLVPTATKTATYTAAVGDLAMMNVPAGGAALTLPTAPADKAQVGYRAIGATNAVPLTINRGGSDTIGTTGATSASIVMADETVVLQYDAANTRWLSVANVKTQPSLDAAYGNPLDAGYDIIVCAGQSIMSGRGGPVDTVHYDVSDPRIWQYAQAGSYANTISQAIEPLGYPDSPSGVGLGLGFARWYLRAVAPNRQVLLLPVAHGGVPFEGASSPDVGFTWKVGRHDVTNIYDTTLTFIQSALAAAGPNSRVVAVLWAHGETDGVNTTSGATYQADLDALIAQFRTDLSLPNLPFIISGMVPEYLTTGTRAAIDTVQAATPGRVANTAYVYGVWDQASGDGSHYAVAGPRQVAVSMFRGWVNVAKGGPAVTAPAPTPITLTTTAGNAQVTISGTGGHGYSGTTFALYRGTTPTGTVIATALPFTDTGRTNGTSYSYVAKATNAQGTVVSNIATATPAVSPGAGVTDSFDRANSTTSLGVADSGQTWVASQGTWGINTNKAYCISAASADHAIIDSGLTDVAVQATLTGTTGSTNPTLILRSDSGGANYYMCNFGNGFATIYKVISGTPTNLGSTSMTLADGDVVKFTCAGTTLTAFKNGTQIVTKTDAVITTGTYVGIRIGSGSSAVRFDAFSAA